MIKSVSRSTIFMRNIIIGTAGHVDHGKTALIKALTGIETDRWEEEKRRGLSIGLGFAHFDLPDGKMVGIIDVPGHERFIRNMLTGVWGMDLILLVVDAIEGVKPQTVEHLNIIDLLKISNGIVVITKIDLAPEEQVERVVQQVKKLIAGKSLDNSPVVRVSAITGQGMGKLKETIVQKLNSTEPSQRSLSAPRLPVDRAFVISGFGMVVTGTLIGGSISKQDPVNIMPGGKRARVRGVEVHDKQVETAIPGQRVALNLSGITKEDVKRGDVVCHATLSESTDRIDTILQIVDTSERIFENWTRVRLFLDTSESFGRAVLLSTDEGMLPEDMGYVQFKMENPIFAFRGDRFIIRDFTNQETLGGGVILNPFPTNHKRLSKETIQQLKQWESAKDEELVKLLADTSKSVSIWENTLKYYLPYTGEKTEELLKNMKEQGTIVRYISGDKSLIASAARMADLKGHILTELSKFHKDNPITEGANYSKVRSDLDIDELTFELLLQNLIENGEISRRGNILRLSSHQITFTERELKLGQEIERIFLQNGFLPPDETELINTLSSYKREEIQNVFQALLLQGRLIKVSGDIHIHSTVVEETIKTLKEYLKSHGKITISEFRQLVNTSRKYAVPFMEYCDTIRLTIREGDYRKLKEGR
jgi:selenocysteine-specific elongation factor